MERKLLRKLSAQKPLIAPDYNMPDSNLIKLISGADPRNGASMTTTNTTQTERMSAAAPTFSASTSAPSCAPAGHRFVPSIRTKGLIVIAVLLVYSIVIALFAFNQKNQLLRDFEEIQGALETEALLKQADLAAFHAVMAIFANIDAPDHAEAMQRIEMHHQSLQDMDAVLDARLPDNAMTQKDLSADWEMANKNPSKANLNRLGIALIKIKDALSAIAEQVQENRKSLSARYRAQTDSVAMMTFLLGMLGLGLLGAIIMLFFRRLTDDLRILQNRALDIVNGFRGKPMAITRHDEVGQLMIAVNNMAHTLDLRDKELMLERQKYFHQEKMAAIGALAAGVSHEIGNPIAAISGIAQDMIERRTAAGSDCTAGNCQACRPDLIHVQTQRLAAITREIAEFASPRAVEPQLLDLNAQLRSTSSLIRYDKRLQHVTLRLDLDSQLPAIYGVADQLTQLIMNLLINAMDALDGVQGRPPSIVITTCADLERACVAIEDNGHGIDSATLGRVFEAFFTTKPAGKGTGLGLSLCYSIAKRHGGAIEIDSTPGAGTRVQVFFPLNDTAYNETK